jgi:anti-sigma-K factor RskA
MRAAGFVETTARLASAAAVTPPAGLKARTLAEVSRTRQLPPAVGGARSQPPSAHTAATRRRSWWRAAAVAASALVVGGSVALAVQLNGSGPAKPTMSAEIAAVLAAPDSKMIDGHVRTGGMATVVMSEQERSLVFVASGLAPLAPSKCYELWLVGRSGDRTVAVLPYPNGQVTGPILASDIQPNDRLALSVEPQNGSPQPTSAMLLVLTV